MFDSRKEKENSNQKEKFTTGLTVWIGIGIFILLIGVSLLTSAWGFNQTAIDELQAEFITETTYGGTFPFFYMAFMIVMLAGFMVAMFTFREDRESVFFSLSALIIALVLTLLFTSPLTFDLQEHENSLKITANDTTILLIEVTQQTNQIPIIPYDESFRMATSLIFTGLTIFLGLYSMYIITNYHEGRKLNPNR